MVINTVIVDSVSEKVDSIFSTKGSAIPQNNRFLLTAGILVVCNHSEFYTDARRYLDKYAEEKAGQAYIDAYAPDIDDFGFGSVDETEQISKHIKNLGERIHKYFKSFVFHYPPDIMAEKQHKLCNRLKDVIDISYAVLPDLVSELLLSTFESKSDFQKLRHTSDGWRYQNVSISLTEVYTVNKQAMSKNASLSAVSMMGI